MAGLSEEDFINQFSVQDGAGDGEEQGKQEGGDIQDKSGDIRDDGAHDDDLKLTDLEQKAYDKGWRPKEQFDGPEDKFKTAKEYIRDGEWLQKLKESSQRVERLEREFNERLENTNKLHEARRIAEIAALKKKQREAVDVADSDAYDETQRQIDELESQKLPAPASQQNSNIDPLITDWISKNPWINDKDDDRTVVAMGALQVFQSANPNATIQQAIDHVESRVNKLFRPQNPRRDQPNMTEHGRRPSQRQGKGLTMSDLTNDERREWDMFGKSMFKTEEAFLKAVKDSRSNS